MEKLRRQRKGKKLTGLCAGIARLIGIDASYVRLAWLAATLVPPFNHLVAIAAYVLLVWIVPVEGREEALEHVQ